MMAQPCPGLALTPLAPPGLESLGFAEHGALQGCLLPHLSLDSALLGLETIPDPKISLRWAPTASALHLGFI